MLSSNVFKAVCPFLDQMYLKAELHLFLAEYSKRGDRVDFHRCDRKKKSQSECPFFLFYDKRKLKNVKLIIQIDFGAI